MGYPDDVKGYRLLDPSTDILIIEHSVHFEEDHLHAPSNPHVETFVPFHALDIGDDESTHSDHGLDLRSEFDLEDDEHVNDEHPYDEPPQMPKLARTTL